MSEHAAAGRDFGDRIARVELLARPAKEYPSVFPLALYGEWLDTLVARGVEFITYDDLFAECDDRDFERGYPTEWQRWRGRRDRRRIQVLIQHDVDYAPEFTARMMVLEAERGVRSNVFVFAELSEDFPPGSPYGGVPYVIDDRFLRGATQAGFVVGYHQNVVPRCDGTMAGAERLFRSDLGALRSRFDVRYFCPHGGRGAMVDGRELRNYDVPVPADLGDSLRWVYNRYALRWSGRWSDGGLRRLSDPAKLDGLNLLGAFSESLQPGERYFVLVHPQLWGYCVDPAYNPELSKRPWYEAMLRRYTT
jgi:hypothetical protein